MDQIAFRAFAAASLCFLSGQPALAAPPTPKNGPQTVEMTKVLPFYDRYLALAPENRDGFTLTYHLRPRDGAPMPNATVIHNGQRRALRLGPNGRILDMPDAATLRAATVEFSGRGGVSLETAPVVTLSRRIEAAALLNAIDDMAAAKRSVGPAGALMPSLTAVAFEGVTAAEAVFADGRRAALPKSKEGEPLFRPRDRAMRGAIAVEFAGAPRKAKFAR